MTIPFCDLTYQQREIATKLEASFKQVMAGGIYMMGQKLVSFEKECAAFFDVPYVVGVASGSDALTLGIQALGLSTADEVIVPANSYPSIWGIIRSGVRPVLSDIVESSLAIDEVQLSKLLTKRTKAIVVVHLFGVNMLTDSLKEFARKHNLFLIEDCAQSFGAEKEGKKVGNDGDVATFSFYPTKPLGGYGDGGMVTTKNKDVFKRLQRLRMYGEVERYQSVEIGVNSRLDELQAALLSEKLPHLNRWIKERKKQDELYREHLVKIKEIHLVRSPWIKDSAFHLFPIRTAFRDELQAFLAKNGIGTAIHYPLALSEVPSLQGIFKNGSMPVAEKVSKQLLSLPLYNGLGVNQQKLVIKAVQRFFLKI